MMNNDNRQTKHEKSFLIGNTHFATNSFNSSLTNEAKTGKNIQPIENKIDVVEKLIDYLKRE